MKTLKRIFPVLLLTLLASVCQSQSDTMLFDTTTSKNAHGIRLSFGLGGSPIWHLQKNKKDDFNFSTGFLTSINFDNWFEASSAFYFGDFIDRPN